ncbi:MAG: hypothetical protein P8H35_03535, partial [Flavobacteriales bacterium]|nr:hypothetical protein [Flavobacteriales bacterium]
MNYRFYIFFLLFFLSTLFETGYSQCPQLIIDAGTNQSICSGQSVLIGGSPTVSNNLPNSSVSYYWSPNTNISSISANNPTVNPTTTTKYYLYVQQTDSLGVICNAVDSVITTVNLLPNVTLNNFSSLCIDAGSVALSGGSPTGGTYSGNGVAGNSFTPSNAGVGTHSITYSYIDANGCSSSATKNIVVNPLPSATLIPNPSSGVYCQPPCNSLSSWTKCGFQPGDILNMSMMFMANNSNSTIYSIGWDNGQPNISNLTAGTFYNSTYSIPGYYNLNLYMTDTITGCSNNLSQDVFWGSNPGGGITNPSTTALQCAPQTYGFPASFVDNNGNPNAAGTMYTVSYNDGTPDSVFYHPSPASNLTNDIIYRTWNNSSCGYTAYSGAQNSFDIQLVSSNACGISFSAVAPIVLSSTPEAHVSYSRDTIGCYNQTVFNFSDSSDNGFVSYYDFSSSSYSCDSVNAINWVVDPPTGYTLQYGNLGFSTPIYGFPSTYGSDSISLIFNDPGDYSVTFYSANQCGQSSTVDSVKHYICIDSIAHSEFILDQSKGCFPLSVQASNISKSLNSCEPEFLWEVSYIDPVCNTSGSWSFDGVSSSSSIDAGFVFNNSGFYEISLKAINDCDTAIFLDTVKVQTAPNVNLNSVSDYCDSVVLAPSAIFDSCESVINSYQWTFYAASPSSSTLSSPNNINFNQLGTNSVVVEVTNQCGSNKDSVSFDIHSSPVISLFEEDSICIGNSVQLLPSVISGTPNFNYSWTVSDSSLSAYNILSPNANPLITSNYSLTVSDIHNCQDVENITIEVLDLPVVDAGPDQNKCFLDTALFNASISGAIPPYSFLWSPAGFLINDNLLNPKYISVLNKTFYLSVVDDFGCTNSDTISIDTITLPLISVPNDTILCNLPVGVNFSANPSGGYWRGNGVNSSGLFTPYATGFFDIIYNFTDPSTGCDNEDTLRIEVVSPNLANAGLDVSVCEDTNAIQLIGSPVSSTGFWFGAGIDSAGNYLVSNPGSFIFSYSHGEGNCLTTDQVTLTVHDLPVVDAGLDVSFCVDAGVQTLLGSPSGGIWIGSGVSSVGDFD